MSKFTLFRPWGKVLAFALAKFVVIKMIQNYSFPLRTEHVQFEDFTTDNTFGIIYLLFFQKNKLNVGFHAV